ncbi:MAG: sulfite exporter TauE/SafE family protein [Candidatus Methylopumilus sp.]|nr:sulfite exporter TauE/SafE family protein [Candidatus Methylopumilus sp.]
MQILLTEIIILTLAGSLIGILSGLLGIGGGLIIVPLLTFTLIHFHEVTFDQAMLMAIGTSLASIIFTAGMSSYFHKKRNNMDWSIAIHYIPGVLLGASVMAFIIPHLNIVLIKHTFIIYTFLAAYKIFKGQKIKSVLRLPTFIFASFYGFIIASISTIIGIGGGTMFVPYFIYHKINPRLAVALSSSLGIFIGLGASFGFIKNGSHINNLPQLSIGYIYLPGLLLITSSSLIFVRLATKWIHQIPVLLLKKIFACLLFFIGLSMLFTR